MNNDNPVESVEFLIALQGLSPARLETILQVCRAFAAGLISEEERTILDSEDSSAIVAAAETWAQRVVTHPSGIADA